MPYHEPDKTDPMALRGVVIETDSDSATRDMAECFVEEFLRSGFDAERILEMFRSREYAGPFLATQTLGEDAIRQIISELTSLRGHRSPKDSSAPDSKGPPACRQVES